MEYSFMLPHSYKSDKGVKKRILKDIVYDYIPKEMMERPKKGFSVPLAQWLRGPLREQLLEYSGGEYLRRQGLFAEKEAERFLQQFLTAGDKGSGSGQNYSRMIWAYFMFQKWYEHYVKD